MYRAGLGLARIATRSPIKFPLTSKAPRPTWTLPALRFDATATRGLWQTAQKRLAIQGPTQLPPPAARPASPASRDPKTDPVVGYWLLLCAGSVFGIVVWGGLTRLTESGLSITEWNLIRGMALPQSEAEWNEQFEKYKQFPEYKLLNHHMTLEEFKRIYWYEWFHRMWGRAIGVLVTVPGVYFAARGKMSRSVQRRCGALAVLIGAQGALGWYMVRSGLDPALEETPGAVPRVSQYRLAAHLGTAFLAYVGMLWTAMDVLYGKTGAGAPPRLAPLRHAAHGVAALVFATAMSGALVAGLDAGLVYNEWPTMGHGLLPDDLWALSDPELAPGGRVRPAYLNLLENPSMVQFQHRWLGYTAFSSITALWLWSRRLPLPPVARRAMTATMAMGVIQPLLGIFTLLYYVPTPLAATHQAGSLTLLSCVLWLMHRLR